MYLTLNILKEFNGFLKSKEVSVIELCYLAKHSIIRKICYSENNTINKLNNFLTRNEMILLVILENKDEYKYICIKTNKDKESKYDILYTFEKNKNDIDIYDLEIIKETIPEEIEDYLIAENLIKKKEYVPNYVFVPNNYFNLHAPYMNILLDVLKNLKETDFKNKNKINDDELIEVIYQKLIYTKEYQDELERVLFNESPIINKLTGTNLSQKGFTTIYEQINYRERYLEDYLKNILIQSNIVNVIYKEHGNNEIVFDKLEQTIFHLILNGYLYVYD